MSELDFGHIKRICKSDAGHGMTKTALIHWVLGSISEVERLEAEALLHKTFGIDQRKEGMEAAVKAVKETDLKDCYPGEDLTIGAWNDCREQIAISIVAAIRAAAKEQA